MKTQLYLHYPKSWTRLTIDQPKNFETISSDLETKLSETVAFSSSLPGGQVSIENNTLSKICTTCFWAYINKCLICEQISAYAVLRNIAMENDDSSQEGSNINNLR